MRWFTHAEYHSISNEDKKQWSQESTMVVFKDSVNFYSPECITSLGRTKGEPLSSLKKVFVEHIEKYCGLDGEYGKYGFTVENPSGHRQVIIHVPQTQRNYLDAPDLEKLVHFLEFYDKAAKRIWEWWNTAQTQALYKDPTQALSKDLPKEKIQALYKEKIQADMKIILESDGPPPRLEAEASLQAAQASAALEPIKQVKPYKQLVKRDFKQRIIGAEPVGTGRSNPDWIFFKSKKGAEKIALLKESSLIVLQINKCVEVIKNPSNKDAYMEAIAALIMMGLPEKKAIEAWLIESQKISSEEVTRYLYSDIYTAINKDSIHKIDSFNPFVSAIQFIKNIKEAINDPQPRQKLEEIFQATIKRERAYAALSGLFVRILVGPMAPKVKYITDPADPSSLKLLADKVLNSKDTVDASLDDSYFKRFVENAPEFAQAMLVRYLVGCSKYEARQNNLLCVKKGEHDLAVIPIDTDISFTDTHPQLRALLLGGPGAQDLLPSGINDKQNKDNWNSLFTAENSEQVKDAFLVMFKRAASVLTDEVIETVVNYVMNQENEIFSLPQSKRDHIVWFMQETRKIALDKIKEAGLEYVPQEPEIAAPWLKEMMAEISAKQAPAADSFLPGM